MKEIEIKTILKILGLLFLVVLSVVLFKKYSGPTRYPMCYFELGQIKVKLADKGTSRYLFIQPKIGYIRRSDEIEKEIELKKEDLRAIVVSVFEKETTVDLAIKGKKELVTLKLINEVVHAFKQHNVISSIIWTTDYRVE